MIQNTEQDYKTATVVILNKPLKDKYPFFHHSEYKNQYYYDIEDTLIFPSI